MGEDAGQLCIKQGGKCAVFTPQPGHLDLWVKVLTDQYVNKQNNSDHTVNHVVNTTSGEEDATAAQERFQIWDKAKNKNKLLTITVFRSTGTIMAQGKQCKQWADEEYPRLSGAVKYLSEGMSIEAAIEKAGEVEKQFVSDDENNNVSEELNESITLVKKKAKSRTISSKAPRRMSQVGVCVAERESGDKLQGVVTSLSNMQNVLVAMSGKLDSMEIAFHKEAVNISESVKDMKQELEKIKKENESLKEDHSELRNQNQQLRDEMQSLINRQKAEHDQWRERLNNLSEEIESKHEICKSVVESKHEICKLVVEKSSNNSDTKRRQLKNEIDHITAELEKIKTKVFPPEPEQSSIRSTTTNMQVNDNHAEGSNQSVGTWGETQVTSPTISMKDKASTLIKTRPLIIHGSIGRRLHGRKLLPGMPAQKRWAPTIESATDLVCEMASANTAPESIILMVGTRNLSADNEQSFRDKLNTLCELTGKLVNTKVYMCNFLPRLAESSKVKIANQVLREACIANGIYVIDIYTPFLEKIDSWFSDPVHHNQAGLVCIVQKIRQALETTGVYIQRKGPSAPHGRNRNLESSWGPPSARDPREQRKPENREQYVQGVNPNSLRNVYYPREGQGHGYPPPPPPYHYPPLPPLSPQAAYMQGNSPQPYPSTPWGVPTFPWPALAPAWPTMR